MKPIESARRFASRATVIAALCAAASGSAMAQAAVVETAPAFASFDQWVGATIVAVPDVATPHVEPLKPAVKGGATGVKFEPLPVILGVPDLPLLGQGARQAAKLWGTALNYQGVHAQLLQLDAKTQKLAAAPMGAKLKVGAPFKIRVAATFDAVASLDQVLGSTWDAQRTGQVYPQAGLSVELKAGKTMDLPIGEGQFFVLDGRPGNERLILSVRHAKALGSAGTNQPAYRQDGNSGSSYLQMVPKGQYPVVEQVLTLGK
jgi:hypothetical protein